MVYSGDLSVNESDMKTCTTCQISYPDHYAVCPTDGSPLAEIGLWVEGSIVRGKYRLLAKVGQGGMGSVYKALHLAFDELRALKVIAPELLADALFVKRFKHEAVITRRLQHPNAVRVDDIDEAEDGRPFIVMEFIEGRSLKKLIREEGPLAVPRVLSLVKQCASALEAAHNLGMVHRDIKPDNIALVAAPQGEMVKVLDFGIAKMKEARMGESVGMTLTGAGVVIGTPQYMSPEQAMGKRGDDLDGRADLYSLGVVMYQMLTADLPFKAETTMEMLLAHMQQPPAPIEVLHPELQVPGSVTALTMRLLEKIRDMRPASAGVLIQEIEAVEHDLANFMTTRVVAVDDLAQARGTPGATGRAAGVAVPSRPRMVPGRPVDAPKSMPSSVGRPPIPAAAPAKHAESRWGMWVALIVLLVGLGGGGLYIATRLPSSAQSAPAAILSATLTANPATVEKGQPVTLRWSSQNATNLDLQPGVGKVPADGFATITPQDSTTYTLTAMGPNGTQTPQAHVSVSLPATPPASPPPSNEFTSKPVSPVHKTKNAPKAEAPAVARITEPPKPAPAPPAVDPAKVKAQLTMANFHLGRGEYDEAITALQEGLKIDSSNAELRKKLDDTIRACTTERKALGGNFKCGEN